LINLTGRAVANNAEPDFISLLHYLKQSWDADIFVNETEPLLESIDIQDVQKAEYTKAYHY